MHQIVGALAGKNHATLFRNGCECKKQAGEEWILDWLGSDRLWPVKLLEEAHIIHSNEPRGNIESCGELRCMRGIAVLRKKIVGDGVGAEFAAVATVRGKFLCGGRNSGGVQAAAQKDAGALCVQAIGNGGLPDGEKIFDVLIGARMADAAVHWDVPIAAEVHRVARNEEGVCGRKALKVTESGGGVIAIQAEEQKIGYGGIVEFGGNSRMEAHRIQHVAEDQNGIEQRVVKRFDAEMRSEE